MQILMAVLQSPHILFPLEIMFGLPKPWIPTKRKINSSTCRCCGREDLSWIWEGRKPTFNLRDSHFYPIAPRFAA